MKNLNGVGTFQETGDDLIYAAFENQLSEVSLSWKQFYQLSQTTKEKLFTTSFDSTAEGITFYLINRHKPHKKIPNLERS